MLQQTRIEAALPYFYRFVEVLPDIPALAKAEEATLLKLWEGLGYYNRVRNLQKAASIIVDGWGICPVSVRRLVDTRHIFTHIEWHMHGYWCMPQMPCLYKTVFGCMERWCAGAVPVKDGRHIVLVGNYLKSI